MYYDDGVPGDREMELEEHLIELGKRMLVFFAFFFAFVIIFFPFSDNVIEIVISKTIPQNVNVITLSPVEIVSTRIAVSMALAFAASSPVFIYEIFAFMRPGLFPSERKFFLSVVPTSAFLFITGAAFSYVLFLSKLVYLLIYITRETAIPVMVLSRFMHFVSFVLLSFGMIFQIPLVIYLLLKFELIEKQTLKENRKYAYAALFFIASILNPEPTMAAPLLITGTFIVLFEISLKLFAG